MRLLFVLLLLLTVKAHAAPSLLGMCHKDWNCDATIKLYDSQERIILSWLEGTFARSCKCVDRLLTTPKLVTVRAHLINSVCMRNKRCGLYETLWGYTAASASRAVNKPGSRLRRRFDKVLTAFKRRIEGKSITCYVSTCLECDLYEPARRTLANLVSAALPNCNIVDNPFRRKCLPGYICEKHGFNPNVSKPCIVDLDGTDGTTIDVKNWVANYKHCDLQFYWERWMNCINDSFVDPRSRNCKYDTPIFDNLNGILCQYFYPSSDTCLL